MEGNHLELGMDLLRRHGESDAVVPAMACHHGDYDPETVEVNTAYIDAGATATNTEDGDLTANIVTGGDSVDTATLGDYTITYNVTDSSGNAAPQVTRTVSVVDTTPPVITLLGSDPVQVLRNAPYTDAGATWREVTEGLPEGHKGKIGLAVSPVDPDRRHPGAAQPGRELRRLDRRHRGAGSRGSGRRRHGGRERPGCLSGGARRGPAGL